MPDEIHAICYPCIGLCDGPSDASKRMLFSPGIVEFKIPYTNISSRGGSTAKSENCGL